MDLRTATAQEIEHNYGLYNQAIKLMQKCGETLPGVCCGKHQDQHCRLFVQNREKYIRIMEHIENRTIKPLKHGIVYIASIKQMINYDLLTDAEILNLTNSGYLSKDFFDWSGYQAKNTEQSVEPTVEQVEQTTETLEPTVKTKTPTKKSQKKSKK